MKRHTLYEKFMPHIGYFKTKEYFFDFQAQREWYNLGEYQELIEVFEELLEL